MEPPVVQRAGTDAPVPFALAQVLVDVRQQ
jgi:hypothetical protein